MKKNSGLINFLILSISIMLISFLIVDMLIHSQIKSILKQQLEEKNNIISQSVLQQVNCYINETKKLFYMLKGEVSNMKSLLGKHKLNIGLERMIKYFSKIEMIQIIDENGNLINMAPYYEKYSGIHISDFLLAKELLNNLEKPILQEDIVHFSQVIVSPITLKSTIVLYSKFDDGKVLLYVNLKQLSKSLQEINVHKITSVSVLDDKYNYIAYSNQESNNLEVNIKSQLEKLKKSDSTNINLQEKNNSKRKLLVSIRTMNDINWKIVVYQDLNKAYSSLYTIETISYIGTIFTMVLTLLISYYIISKVKKAIELLSERINEISEGNYDLTFDYKSYKELNELFDRFKNMAEAVNIREKMLKESEEKYRVLVETATDPIFTVDGHGIFISANQETEKKIPSKETSIIGKSIFDVFPQEFAKKYYSAIQKIFTIKKPVLNLKTNAPTKEGNRWFNISLVPIIDDEGDVLYVEGISRDITSDYEMQEELENTLSRLKTSNKDLEDFAYIASHDLQAPLRAIIHYNQILEKKYFDLLDEKGKNYIDRMIVNGKRLQTMINDLLIYSRSTTGTKISEKHNMREIIDTAIDNLEFIIEKTQTEIKVSQMPYLKMDRPQMIHVFQNLIDNAIKYKKPDETPKISIASRLEKDFWIFSIQDNGIGIDKKYAKKIFQIFFNIDSNENEEGKRRNTGNGIGLSIAKKIIERHKGEIYFESEINKGTTFYFTLPK